MWEIILLIVGIVLGAGLIFSLFFTFLTAYIVYSKTLMRSKKSSWGREKCSEPGCIPLETMWTRGLEWKEGFKRLMTWGVASIYIYIRRKVSINKGENKLFD